MLTRAAKRASPEYEEEMKIQEEKENKEKQAKLKPKDIFKYPGEHTYTTDFIDCASICDDLIKEAEKIENLLILGFDLEWPFSFKTGAGKTALMQICASTNDRIVYLFQLSEFQKLPATLITLLSHPKVRIAGVNIRNDVHKLCRDFAGIDKEPLLNNCVDSRTQAKEQTGLTGWSMDKLVNYCFDKSVNKDDKVRKSKWDVLPLSKEQIIYAATDAYISLQLYNYFMKLAQEKELEDQNQMSRLLELL